MPSTATNQQFVGAVARSHDVHEAQLVKGALNPFYVFQVFSISIWFSDNYYYYASVILIMSVLSIAVDVYQIRVNQKALRDTISSSGTVTLIRRILPTDPVMNSSDVSSSYDVETKNVVVCSTKLVPGDIIVIPNHGCVMQCDAVLLNGNCIVNESMLTGESVPVTKTPIPKVESLEGATFYGDKHHAKHTLYNGTKVLQTRYYSGQQVKALVIRTGYSTMKGHLVRSIMYPKPVDFEFTKDLLRFVGVLACIAGIGFLYTIVLMSMSGIGVTKIFLRAMDIITIVVPPALPAAMTIGVIAAEHRLKKKNIYCISPTTINTCGGLNVVCFDKTGTLTEEGLDLLGVLPCKS
uniref:Cation-transporting ATPase 13A3 n=1 Tax=Romanomermis culicivorax TaxID=13658 RepID=A0A915JNU7_ROMCU